MGRLLNWLTRKRPSRKKQMEGDQRTTLSYLMTELRAARKEIKRLTTVIIHMEEAGKQYVPKISDTDFGSYAIEDEERRNVENRVYIPRDVPSDVPIDVEDEDTDGDEGHPDHDELMADIKARLDM